MAEIICHHKGRYNLYSSISDGFCYTSSLSLMQLQSIITQHLGSEGLRALPKRVERARELGTSSMLGYESLDDFLTCNRAGKNEKHLTTEECIKQFLS